MTGTPQLELVNVTKTYDLGREGLTGPRREVHAVDNVSLSVAKGETLGLVGESGCGKSSLARLIMQLERPTKGTISLGGQNLADLNPSQLHAARRRFQMVFQDPYTSLNPRMKARKIIFEALHNYQAGTPSEIELKVEKLAAQVGLSSYHLDRFPHELSGGQCQRVGIARAIALSPELIVTDEPVSALDVSIQAQILNLIVQLQVDMALTLVFVSHDLSVVAHVADRVAVMYLGRVVELAESQALFADPAHPYTQTLMAAIPRPVPSSRHKAAAVRGELPSPLNPPSGCHFRTRCPHATERCAAEVPKLRDYGKGREVACHFAEEIALGGSEILMEAARG